MVLVLAFVLLLGAVAALGTALKRDEQPVGLERALRALEQQGLSGRDVDDEVDRSFTERVLEPLQARALGLGRRLTGSDKAERIRTRLDLAGNPRNLSVDNVVSLKVIGAIAVPAVLLLYGLMLGFAVTTLAAMGLVGLVLGFFSPDLYLYQCTQKRADQVRRTLADAVDLLTISVEAGLAFDAAVQQVARNTEGPIAEELSRVLREMQLGMSRSDALRSMATRTNVEELQTFVGSMVQADAFGVPIGQVLRVQSSDIRLKRRQYAEEKAQEVPVKIMIPLVICILPCLFVVVMAPAVLSAMDSFGG